MRQSHRHKVYRKAKDAVKMVAAQNRGIFATVALFGLIFVLIAAVFPAAVQFCRVVLQRSFQPVIPVRMKIFMLQKMRIELLEEALNTQINQMEFRHPDYDEYRYQIDEIGHNPYQLISYLTVKYGGFTYAEVADEIKEIFRAAIWNHYRVYQRNCNRNKDCPGRGITGTGCYQWILQLFHLLWSVEWRTDRKWSNADSKPYDCRRCDKSFCSDRHSCSDEWRGICGRRYRSFRKIWCAV